jgi:hypothetical protein
MPDAALQVEVRVGTDGAVKGFKIASSSAVDAAELIRSSLEKISGGSEEAKRKQEGFISTLRDFKTEATQNSRVARFFANDLAVDHPGRRGRRRRTAQPDRHRHRRGRAFSARSSSACSRSSA